MTLLSIYVPGSRTLNIDRLNEVLQQLTPPVLILGNFNAHNILWGCRETSNKGKTLENFCNSNNLNILNNGAPTRILYNTESAIDISICSPVLQPIIEWSVYTSPGGCDHCPIIVSLPNVHPNNTEATDRYNVRHANWDVYSDSSAWNNIPDDIIGDNNQLIEDLMLFYQAADASIPKYTPSIFYPKPWWTPS